MNTDLPRSPRSASGMTVLELVVGMTLLTLAFGISASSILTTSDATRTSVALAAANQAAHRGMARVTRILMESSASTFPVPPLGPLGSSSLTFRRADGFLPDAVSFGDELRIELQDEVGEPQDGIDNDEDGLVDERNVVLIQNLGQLDERTTLLVGSVSPMLEGETLNAADDNGNGLTDEAGLSFVLEGNILRMRLTILEPTSYGKSVSQTVETTIIPRN